MECFTVYSNELDGILSPLFFISKPKNTKGFIELKKVANINPSRKRPNLKLDDKVPYVGLPETGDLEIKQVLRRPYKEVKGRNIIKQGDILFARIEPSIFNQKYIFVSNLESSEYAFTSTEFYIVESKNNIVPEFLFYMFFSDLVYKQVIGKTTGSTGRRRLDKGVFEKLMIPYPNIETQNRIVEIMKSAYAIKKQKKQEAIKLLNSINDYVLAELDIKLPELKDKIYFTVDSKEVKNNRSDSYYFQPKFKEVGKALEKGKYTITKLNKISDKITSGQRPKGGVRQIKEGIPSLGGEHVLSNGSILTQDLKYIPIEFHKMHLKSKVAKKDIIIVKDGATTGKVGIVPENYPFEEVNINEHVFLVRCKKEINPYYLFAFLKSQIGQIQINREITGGTIMGIVRESVDNLKIPIPAIKIQNKIAKEVKTRMESADELNKEAEEILIEAKAKVEKIITGSI